DDRIRRGDLLGRRLEPEPHRRQAKITADMADLKSKVAERKHDLTVKRATNYSQLLDEEASFAIDYAIASIEQAKVAVLDAIAGRLLAALIRPTASEKTPMWR